MCHRPMLRNIIIIVSSLLGRWDALQFRVIKWAVINFAFERATRERRKSEKIVDHAKMLGYNETGFNRFVTSYFPAYVKHVITIELTYRSEVASKAYTWLSHSLVSRWWEKYVLKEKIVRAVRHTRECDADDERLNMQRKIKKLLLNESFM